MEVGLRFGARVQRFAAQLAVYAAVAVVFVMLLVAAPRAAFAQPGPSPQSTLPAPAQEPAQPRRTRFYFGSVISLGYGHYWQFQHAEREFHGFVLDVGLAFGVKLGERLVLGATGDVLLFPKGTKENHVANYSKELPPTAGGYLGPALILLPSGETGRFRFELAVGGGGAGASGEWGGRGLFLHLAPGVVLLNAGRVHLALQAKLMYAQLFGDGGGIRPFLTASGGANFAFY